MAESGVTFRFNIKKFDGTDFVLWKDKVLSALNASQCSEAIKESFESDSPEKILKDEKAKVILMTSIEDKILRRLKRKTAKEIWTSLTNRYENKNFLNIMCLRKKILNSKQEDNESVESFIDRVQNLSEEIEALGLKMTDQDIAMTIMQGLISEYDNFVQCLTVNTDINDPNDLDLDEIINALIIEEKRRYEKNELSKSNNGDRAFHSKGKNFKKKKYFKNVKCYNCNKMGHYASDCKSSKTRKENSGTTKNANVNINKSDNEEFIFHTNNSQNSKTKNIWLLDSGATNHLCCVKSMFKDLKPHNSKVKVGDGRDLEVIGIGNIEAKITSRNELKSLTLTNVLFVPELSVNLISIGKLSNKGYKILFEKDKCNIMLNNQAIIEAKCWSQNKNLYELKLIFQETERALTNIKPSDFKLWHYRLGHLSFENMKKIRAEDIDFRKIAVDKEFCESCTLGKSTKLPHKTKETNSVDENYVTIHSDLVGPMKTSSIGSKLYILTYLCSRTEYSFVYFLKNKSEQFAKFKEFKSSYELLTDKKIKEFRTDNGREYLSNEFNSYLKDCGIKHNTSVEYCPQMNGKAERLNRTLIEKARCMILAAKVNLNLWSAGVDTANYLRNRSPSAALNGKTPFEALFGKLPKLSHLKVFGCEAFPLITNKIGNKFDPVAKNDCIMIGYGESEGIYWVYDKKNHKVFRSRDIRFNENSILDNNKDETNELILSRLKTPIVY
ncbi:unnamed protein product, partial [Brachionus calyciflorus]